MTPPTVAVLDATRRDAAARTAKKLVEHRERAVGGRNRK